MNRMEEYRTLIKQSELYVPLLDTVLIRAMKRRSKKRRIITSVFFLLCLVFSPVLTLGDHTVENPLVITAHAVNENGEEVLTEMTLNEKVPLYSAASSYDAEFSGYAFDLTLVEGAYLHLAAVDQNWNWIPDKEVHASGDPPIPIYWALTEGDNIALIGVDTEGNVLEGYRSGKTPPRKKGKSMIWIPNEEDMNRSIITCFDRHFNKIVTYYLQIIEVDGTYYGEIVKIE